MESSNRGHPTGRREIEFYNLDAIISVGYRVNSAQATQFRIWATQTLREFVIKAPACRLRRRWHSPLPADRAYNKPVTDTGVELSVVVPSPS